jgi:carbamoyl-phosphate synthase large subunit
MRSTGEVMGIDRDFDKARAKSLLGIGALIPLSGCVFISLRDEDKPQMLASARKLLATGFKIIATGGTAEYFKAQGLEVSRVNKVLEGRPHIVDALKNGEVQLVFNTTEGAQSIKDSRSIRTTALAQKIPCITTATGAMSTVRAIEAMQAGTLEVAPLQSYFPEFKRA